MASADLLERLQDSMQALFWALFLAEAVLGEGRVAQAI